MEKLCHEFFENILSRLVVVWIQLDVAGTTFIRVAVVVVPDQRSSARPRRPDHVDANS